MNIGEVEHALIALRDKHEIEELECTGLSIGMANGSSRRVGNCYDSEAKEATRAALNKTSKTLTLGYDFETTEVRPRISVIDCDSIATIDLHCTVKTDTAPAVDVSITV